MLLSILLAASTAIAGCESGELSLPDDLDAAKNAVVLIEHADGLGSGVIVGDNGDILTAAHVVDTEQEISVQLLNGLSLVAEVIHRDQVLDLALLRLPGNGHNCLTLTGEAQGTGQDVFVIGAPAARELAASVSKGVVSGYPTIAEQQYLQTDASINPGNSGGPMLNTDGLVIGIARAKVNGEAYEGLGFGLPGDTVLAWLDAPVSRESETVADAGPQQRSLPATPPAGYGRVHFTSDRAGTQYKTRSLLGSSVVGNYVVTSYEDTVLCTAPCVIDLPVGQSVVYGQLRNNVTRGRRMWIEDGVPQYAHGKPIALKARYMAGLTLFTAALTGGTLLAVTGYDTDWDTGRTTVNGAAMGGAVACGVVAGLSVPLMFGGGRIKLRDEPFQSE